MRNCPSLQSHLLALSVSVNELLWWWITFVVRLTVTFNFDIRGEITCLIFILQCSMGSRSSKTSFVKRWRLVWRFILTNKRRFEPKWTWSNMKCGSSYLIYCKESRWIKLNAKNIFNPNYLTYMMMIMMMMMMMNCFSGMVDRRNAFNLISSQEHCQRYSPSRISNTPRAGLEPA